MPRYAHEDLICPDGHRSRKLVGDDEFLPLCGHALSEPDERGCYGACIHPTMIIGDTEFDGTHHVQVFKPFTYEGVYYADAAQWNRNKAEIANNLKVPVESLIEQAPDRKRDKVKADEAAHRGWLGRRRSGHDDQSYRQYVKEERRKSGKDTSIVVGYRGTR